MITLFYIYTPDGRVAGTLLPNGDRWLVPEVVRGWIEKDGHELEDTLKEWRESGWIDVDGDDYLAWRVIDGEAVRVVAVRGDAPLFGASQPMCSDCAADDTPA